MLQIRGRKILNLPIYTVYIYFFFCIIRSGRSGSVTSIPMGCTSAQPQKKNKNKRKSFYQSSLCFSPGRRAFFLLSINHPRLSSLPHFSLIFLFFPFTHAPVGDCFHASRCQAHLVGLGFCVLPKHTLTCGKSERGFHPSTLSHRVLLI